MRILQSVPSLSSGRSAAGGHWKALQSRLASVLGVFVPSRPDVSVVSRCCLDLPLLHCVFIYVFSYLFNCTSASVGIPTTGLGLHFLRLSS